MCKPGWTFETSSHHWLQKSTVGHLRPAEVAVCHLSHRPFVSNATCTFLNICPFIDFFLYLSQADGFVKVAPLVALYAGDPKLPEMVEKMVRVTQDNDLAVACSVAGNTMLQHAPPPCRARPLQDPILSFSHTFSPKSTHIRGRRAPNGSMPPNWKSCIGHWSPSCKFKLFRLQCVEELFRAQGKQGIRMLTFPDRENTGNLVNLILTRKIMATQRKFCGSRTCFERSFVWAATRALRSLFDVFL